MAEPNAAGDWWSSNLPEVDLAGNGFLPGEQLGAAGPQAGANPAAPNGQTFQQWFQQATQGKPTNIQTLRAMQKDIEAHGGRLVPNATLGPDGMPTNYDIDVPGVGVVDVLQGASRGGEAWQWLTPNASGGGAGGMGGGSLATPYGKENPNFQGLSPEEFRNSPGYQFALEQGLKGVQSSAFARGTGLTGGTLKSLMSYGTGLADQNFNEAYGRAANTYGMNANNFDRNYGVWRGDNNDIFGRYYNLAQLGAQSAAGATS